MVKKTGLIASGCVKQMVYVANNSYYNYGLLTKIKKNKCVCNDKTVANIIDLLYYIIK